MRLAGKAPSDKAYLQCLPRGLLHLVLYGLYLNNTATR